MGKTIKVSITGGKRINAKTGDVVIKTDQSIKKGSEGSAPEL